MAFVCEWPRYGIALPEAEVDAGIILKAAERAYPIWPDDVGLPDPTEPTGPQPTGTVAIQRSAFATGQATLGRRLEPGAGDDPTGCAELPEPIDSRRVQPKGVPEARPRLGGGPDKTTGSGRSKWSPWTAPSCYPVNAAMGSRMPNFDARQLVSVLPCRRLLSSTEAATA